ncbi:Uncharacterized protein Fot_54470 [Forsythia ovata]|uniref:UBC core domain-containing protein n=1 Tax=Forsythia ovata TaxID=205694 RepID=A0ABD1P782_9LAMI
MENSSPENLILVNREHDGVAYVIINRPKSLNSLTRPMMVRMAREIKSLASDDSVKVIILSGSGRAFCSGVDLTAAEDVFKGDVKDLETDPVAQMERCKKPIIGAINGFAVTAGFEIALACDFLVASREAKFMDTHARFGIFPSWGLSQKLSRIIGPSRAREASLAAMPVTAEQAERWGLVNHVVEGSELLKKARQIAEAIIKNNQDLVLRYKSVINDGFKLDLGHALSLEKERAHEYYDGMTKEQFKKMQEFIAGFDENQAANVEFKHFDVVPEASDHHFKKSKQTENFSKVNSFVCRKIMKEWKSLKKDLPESIYVQVYDTRIDLLRAVIIGNKGTPYDNGLFFFDICLPSNYPFQPPKVYYHAHGLRLNPNLYENGKVCLSLINTWFGTDTEMWTQNSTILQVLISIQGLVLNDRPYFNEPGYEHGKNYICPKWTKRFMAYNEEVFILSCKSMLYALNNPPKNFEIFVVEHFRKHTDSILASVMDYQDYHLLVGSCSIKASSTFKWKLRKMHSQLQNVLDIVSKPNINNWEKLKNVNKATKWMMPKFMFRFDFMFSPLFVLTAFVLIFRLLFKYASSYILH